MNRRVLAAFGLALVIGGCAPADDTPSGATPHASATSSASPKSDVRFADDFATDPAARWEPATPSAWAWHRASANYELTKNVELKEAVRAPFNRNLVKGVVVGDFQLDVDLQSTTRAYPNQSLCLFFGYQDPAHMYYVHFGRATSDTSNQVFIVNGKDRAAISTKTTSGTAWDDGWHHARIVRRVENGTIEVYFDDMRTPAMTADDRTFTTGQVGIGSFDDTGRFDNVVLRNVVSRGQRP